MVRPGRVVAVANVHLSSGADEDAVRLAETRPLEALGRLAADGTPVFLTGDFNSSSHLDAVAGDRERPDDANPLDRAVTRVLADAGLRDSFREAHPDSVRHPGFTWTPGAPHPLLDHDRSRSRIDYVFTGGRSTTVGSEIVGELDGPETDIEVFPWPSDHRAVVSTFQVVPADAPALDLAAPRLVRQGTSVLVRTWDPSRPGMDGARRAPRRRTAGRVDRRARHAARLPADDPALDRRPCRPATTTPFSSARTAPC